MNFSVRLDADQVSVDPGDSAPISIEVTNAGSATDQFEISVEGLDPEWTAVPVPSFSVPAGETAVEKIYFKPPRTSESIASGYPFTVRVRSLESGEARILPATLHVRSFAHLSMEILPKKGVFSALVRENAFQASVINLGNNEQSLQLFGSDPDEALAYTFEPSMVTIGPGQQKDIEVSATPIHSRTFSGTRLHGFTISARNVDQPSIACGAQAQLEQKPLLSPGSIAIVIAFVILILGWLQFAPKDPTVDTFSPDSAALKQGDRFTVTWHTSNAKSVVIQFNGKDLVAAGQPDGSQEFPAIESGTFTIYATREAHQSKPVSFDITVSVPAKPAVVAITRFELDPRVVAPGEDVTVHYMAANAADVVLLPDQTDVSPENRIVLGASMESKTIQAPMKEGRYDYFLQARSTGGAWVQSKKVRLTVRREPKCSIISLIANPATIDVAVAKTQVVWQTKGAVRAELKLGSQVIELADMVGKMDLDVLKSEDLTLTAYDENGLSVTKTIKLTVKAVEPPADDTTKPATTGTTGTGDTGTTPPATGPGQRQ